MILGKPATEKQFDYIFGLAIDCNFTLAERLEFLKRITQRPDEHPITSINDLSLPEASLAIAELLRIKEGRG